MISVLSAVPLTETGIPALVSDYLKNAEQTRPLLQFSYDFAQFKSLIESRAKVSTDRATLTKVLKEQYADLDVTDAVSQNIQLLTDSRTFTVTAAHQPCLFMGPLYNIFKIASAIHLSRTLKMQFPENHFVPVFWLGSEDHDVEELNHTFVSGSKITWDDCGTGASGRWNTASLQKPIQELKTLLNNNELNEFLEESINKHKTFGRFTHALLNRIFGKHGLVVLDQDNPQLKKNFAEIIKDEILNSRATEVLKPNLDFLDKHYKVQAPPRPINFFYLGEGFRERIVHNPDGDFFEIKNTTQKFSRVEMIAEIERHPERFSPNVIMRPVMQEFTLPNLAFAGGSGELSYWLQLKPLLAFYQLQLPMLVHRLSASIVASGVQKKIEKLGISYQNLFNDTEKLIHQFVAQKLDTGISLSEEKNALEKLYREIAAKTDKVDPTLKNAALAELQKANAGLENLEGKMLKAEKRKSETEINQIHAVKSALFHNGVWQERQENFLPFYSDAFIDSIIELADAFKKQFLFLSDL